MMSLVIWTGKFHRRLLGMLTTVKHWGQPFAALGCSGELEYNWADPHEKLHFLKNILLNFFTSQHSPRDAHYLFWFLIKQCFNKTQPRFTWHRGIRWGDWREGHLTISTMHLHKKCPHQGGDNSAWHCLKSSGVKDEGVVWRQLSHPGDRFKHHLFWIRDLYYALEGFLKYWR